MVLAVWAKAADWLTSAESAAASAAESWDVPAAIWFSRFWIAVSSAVTPLAMLVRLDWTEASLLRDGSLVGHDLLLVLEDEVELRVETVEGALANHGRTPKLPAERFREGVPLVRREGGEDLGHRLEVVSLPLLTLRLAHVAFSAIFSSFLIALLNFRARSSPRTGWSEFTTVFSRSMCALRPCFLMNFFRRPPMVPRRFTGASRLRAPAPPRHRGRGA